MEGLSALFDIVRLLFWLAVIGAVALVLYAIVRDRTCLLMFILALGVVSSGLMLLWGVITGNPGLVWGGFIGLVVLGVPLILVLLSG